ncbi:uncharacterized protein LOC128683854 isoform X2 [Plodia interpunctella]|nr:uncharacterized protein LOC128683854 isoform X2 [Plodia interpunctella]XP_053625853.1 uncharacterized protein LOC128683854 isoform X2 [Plodia interpunctella]
MNLKLNNDLRGSAHVLRVATPPTSSVKEERRRTGRYIAILVGISLFLLAMYHAWVRRIPIVASLVVPALIMFVYVAWVLYTASRDKHRLLMLDAEAALASPDAAENDAQISELSQHNDATTLSSKDSSKPNSPEGSIHKAWLEISPIYKENMKTEAPRFKMPLILINDKLPEDLDQKWIHIVESINNEKLKGFPVKRRYRRRFCRRKHVVFKRSYSIA